MSVHNFPLIGHFTVVCSATYGCEAAGDLVLIVSPHCFYRVNCVVVILISLASILRRGNYCKTTVKWSVSSISFPYACSPKVVED